MISVHDEGSRSNMKTHRQYNAFFKNCRPLPEGRGLKSMKTTMETSVRGRPLPEGRGLK